MRCPRCGTENRAGRRFCAECGASLALACSACGFSNEAGEKFCGGCGASLASTPPGADKFATPQSYTPRHLAEKILTSRSALEGERKQVTVLFADLKGSMELLADRDPEDARKILDPVLQLMMEAVHRYEGTVNQVMGDGIMALFGAPLAHEDHAVRACYAALRMQESVAQYAEGVFRAHGVPLQIRVGLNSGEVVVRAIGSDLHMDYSAVGQTTHLAARMEQMATPGTILLAPATLQLAEGYVQVATRGPVAVKGLPDPVEVYALTGASALRSRLHASAPRGLTRFVGRDAEIEQLRRTLTLAQDGHGQLIAVVGEPGVGKSRLAYEFTHSHRTQEWLILEAGSVSYGKATSYLPVIDLLKGYFKVHDRETHREIREKVTGKLLTLDRTLEPTLPALLALLDFSASVSLCANHDLDAVTAPIRLDVGTGEERFRTPAGAEAVVKRGDMYMADARAVCFPPSSAVRLTTRGSARRRRPCSSPPTACPAFPGMPSRPTSPRSSGLCGSSLWIRTPSSAGSFRPRADGRRAAGRPATERTLRSRSTSSTWPLESGSPPSSTGPEGRCCGPRARDSPVLVKNPVRSASIELTPLFPPWPA